jgi:hypothetical protein
VSWCDVLGVTDLFTIGLGCDVAGAYLLSRGLLATPGQIARQQVFAYYGYNAANGVAGAEDRYDASLGLRALGAGFALQAVAYAISLSTDRGDAEGVAAAATAVALAIASAGVVMYIWRARRERAVRNTLIDVACCDGSGGEMNLPSAAMLVAFGREIARGNPALQHYKLRESESTPDGQRAYCARVWGVDDVRDAEEHVT